MPAWDTDVTVAPAPKAAPAAASEPEPDWEGGSAQPANESSEQADAQPSLPPARENELDLRLQVMDEYLADIQRPARLYSYGWMAWQVGVISLYGALGATSEGAARTGGITRATIAAGSLGLMLITPQPGRSASKRYRKMPADSDSEKRAKLEAGEKWLAGQALTDKRGTSVARHLLGAFVAVGAGAFIMVMHEDGMREALTTTVGILLTSEVQIATVPRRARAYNQNYAAAPNGPVQLMVYPWASQQAAGASLVGQF